VGLDWIAAKAFLSLGPGFSEFLSGACCPIKLSLDGVVPEILPFGPHGEVTPARRHNALDALKAVCTAAAPAENGAPATGLTVVSPGCHAPFCCSLAGPSLVGRSGGGAVAWAPAAAGHGGEPLSIQPQRFSPLGLESRPIASLGLDALAVKAGPIERPGLG
jgi:hypothetical protein